MIDLCQSSNNIFFFACAVWKVCGGNMMQLFKAQELMAVVVGNEDYDWQALQDNAQYKNGYSLGDQTVSETSSFLRNTCKEHMHFTTDNPNMPLDLKLFAVRVFCLFLFCF